MDAPTPITPPGWYDDGHGQLRWWDGSQWTAHTAPLVRPQAPQPVAAAQPRPDTTTELVQVKSSKLPWILVVVMLLAALLGTLSGLAAARAIGFDTAPLEQTYARYLQAERSGDCRALQEVTTSSFRDDLVDDFTCTRWTSRPPVLREGEPAWAIRFGPFGVLFVDEGFTADDPARPTIVSYTLIKMNGRWQLDSRDPD